jgi:ABC-type glycerol-3-phosphate transport system substrate-binding protein
MPGPAETNRRESFKAVRRIALLLLLILVTGCRQETESGTRLSGRVILWHGWSPEETAVLEDALLEFHEINPDVQVIELALLPDELRDRFVQAGLEGTGPDLLIGSSAWIQQLVEAGLIRSVGAEQLGPAYGQSRRAVTYQERIYGLPLSLAPYALYYNKSVVTEPAQNLEELLADAADGRQVAFVPRFQEAHWGIQAFGPGLFDQAGNLSLEDSGFVPWLAWLSMAQNQPGVILNIDATALLDLFVNGDIAYFVAGPDRQVYLEAEMGEDGFGVATLPSGPFAAAGPLLPVEAVLFYSYSSQQQMALAEALARFLTNQQQGIRFMRELGHVPANPQVAVDGRVYPNVAGFSRQARTSVGLPAELDLVQLFAIGNRVYTNVLAGALEPEAAVCIFGQEVTAAEVLDPEQVTLPPGCELTSE